MTKSKYLIKDIRRYSHSRNVVLQAASNLTNLIYLILCILNFATLIYQKMFIHYLAYSISQTKNNNMGGLTPFQFTKILNAIKDCTNGLQFFEILHTIKQQHTFKWAINPIYQLSKKGIFDIFVMSCYRLTMLKVAYESLKKQENLECSQDPCTMREIFKFTQELNKSIKQEYCIGLQKIPQRKSQNMEFLFFLTCFSVKNSISMFAHSNLILKRLFQVPYENDFLQNMACSLINFQITGIWVRPNLYRFLKKKYYLKKLDYKIHRKAKSVEDLASVFQFLAPVFEKITDEKYKKPRQNNEQVKITEFRNELKSIFQQETQKNQEKTFRKQEKHLKLNVQPEIFKEIENDGTHLFSLAFLRNSNAFMQQRKNFVETKNKKNDSKEMSKHQSKKTERFEVKNKKSEKKNVGLNKLTASLKLFYSKMDRKNPTRGTQKYSVEKWKNKIKSIRCQGSLQRVTLMNRAEKWRKTGNGLEQEEKQIQHQKFNSCFSNLTNVNRLQSQRQSHSKRGFCEFIDTRQPSQIGIVRSIVNFSNTLPEPKYKKISSKDLKNQYEEFNRKINEHEENSLNQNNYMYRLQKALTGTNKF